MRPRPATLWIAAACVGVTAFVGLPLLAVFAETVWSDEGLTTGAWSQLLASEYDRNTMLRSLMLGACCLVVTFVVGFGHAWLTVRTDLPAGRVLGPLGVLPLVVPPILVAMAVSDHFETKGFFACVLLLGISYSPFVAVLAGQGLRSVDGRAYEAALMARGRRGAEWFLFRSVWPELAAGMLLAFVFVVSEHGVPEFLTVKGKTWHTYAEAVFARWSRRSTGVSQFELASPIVAAVPLVLVIGIALMAALRFRARSSIGGDFTPLPRRPLGAWKWPALLLPASYLAVGVGMPVFVMARWGMGSTQRLVPPSFEALFQNSRKAVSQAGDELWTTTSAGAWTALVVVAVALPLAWFAARRNRALDALSVLPIAVPAVLLGIGLIKVYNHPVAVDALGRGFYDSDTLLVAGYAARFLPFGVLTLSGAVRRISPRLEEAAAMTGRGQIARGTVVLGPMLVPAMWSAACLIFVLAIRELDLAAVVPAGNDTIVRRLSNIVHFGGEDVGGPLALMLLAIGVLAPVFTVLLTGKRMKDLS